MKKAKDCWSDWPFLDLVVAILCSLLGVFLFPLLSGTDSETRQGIYASAADVIAVVGGLGSIAVSTYVGLSGRRIRELKNKRSKPLTRNLAFFIFATAGASISCWVAQIVDASDHYLLGWGFVLTGVIWCCLTVVRQAWLFLSLVAISAQDDEDAELDGLKNRQYQGPQKGSSNTAKGLN